MRDCKKAVEILVNRNTVGWVSADRLLQALWRAVVTGKFNEEDMHVQLEQLFEQPDDILLEFILKVAGIKVEDFPVLIEAARREGFRTDALERYLEGIA